MTWVAAAFLVVAFLLLLQWLGLPAQVAAIGATARSALHLLRDAAASDAEKERAMRASSVRLFLLALRLLLATAVALLVPGGVVALLAACGLVDFEAVLARTLSWQILLGASVLGVVVLRVGRRS